MSAIGGWIARVLDRIDDEAEIRAVEREVAATTERFPLFAPEPAFRS